MANVSPDGARRERVVACDHLDGDAGQATTLDRPRHARTNRIRQPHDAQQHESGLVGVSDSNLARLETAVGDCQGADRAPGHFRDLLADFVRHAPARGEDALGRPLHKQQFPIPVTD